jgi:DNA mismatch repair protein MLH1
MRVRYPTCWTLRRAKLSLATSAHTQRKVYSHQKVRTSTQDRTLDSMFPVINPSQAPASSSGAEPSRAKDIKESTCILTSVRQLRSEVLKRRHVGELTSVLPEITRS